MTYEEAIAKCNPIERVMLGALIYVQPMCVPQIMACPLNGEHPHLELVPQFHSTKVAPYTLDFALFVRVKGMEEMRFDIECDGHEWHNATPAQVDRDHRRNRHLRMRGWNVERFSGTQITASAQSCIGHLERAIDDEFAKRVLLFAEGKWEIAA